MIEPQHPRLSVARQCELVSISRSGFYYQPAGETPLNLGMGRARWRAIFGARATRLGENGCAG
jgi:hypothetical protein